MKNKQKELLSSVFLRYFLIILLGLGNLFFIYWVFKPLTIFSSYFLFDIFFDTILLGNIILVNNTAIEIVNACIAGSAYFLLLILNLSIPKISLKKRSLSILFTLSLFFIANILRIFLLGTLALFSKTSFFILHQLTWYLISIALVVLIWFLSVKLLKIKGIPFYTDFEILKKSLYSKTKATKKAKRK